MGVALDPHYCLYRSNIFDKRADESWSYANTKKHILCFLDRVSSEVTEAEQSRQATSPSQEETDGAGAQLIDDEPVSEAEATMLNELDRFHAFNSRGKYAKAKNFTEFVAVYQEWDPLEFWNNKTHQTLFPKIFKANKIVLAYLASSGKQEGSFSIADMTLGKQRKRLGESPELLQATITLRENIRTLKSFGFGQLQSSSEKNNKKPRLSKSLKTSTIDLVEDD
jgi:hypothetical protein